MTRCGLATKSFACLSISMPPTTTVMRRCTAEPRARNCSASWNASSRVGVTTSAKTPKGCSASRCRIGRAKAAVFPLPVSSMPSTCRPSSTGGMHRCCTRRGIRIPSSRHVFTAHSGSPRSSNVLLSVAVPSLSSRSSAAVLGFT